jgi:ABC-type polysaccharide/polyol phosphate export permease
VGAVALFENRISPLLVLLPVYTLLLGLFAVGLGWILASLQVYLRDTAQMVSVGLTFWFWLTPIFITEEQIPQSVRFLLTANPMAYLVRAYRLLLLTSYRAPSLEDFGMMSLFAVSTFVAGGLFFRHMKRGFADVL